MNDWDDLLIWIDQNSESGITMFTPFGSSVPDKKISVPKLKKKINQIREHSNKLDQIIDIINIDSDEI